MPLKFQLLVYAWENIKFKTVYSNLLPTIEYFLEIGKWKGNNKDNKIIKHVP